NCQLHLAAGVTPMRDCGARNHTTLSLRDAAAAGLFPSPRLLVSGPPITITGGHFWWCNGEADGVEGVRRQARLLLKQGVDFLKIMASGGGTLGTNQARASYTVDEIGRLCMRRTTSASSRLLTVWQPKAWPTPSKLASIRWNTSISF